MAKLKKEWFKMRRIIATHGLRRGKNQVIEGWTDFTVSQIKFAEGLPWTKVYHLPEALLFTIINSNQGKGRILKCPS